MTAQRILAVLAACLFVGAVALGTMSPRVMSLSAAVTMVSPTGVQEVHHWLDHVCGVWAWDWVVHPLMVRPAWLPVGALGLILGGIAFSLPGRDATRRSHRRS